MFDRVQKRLYAMESSPVLSSVKRGFLLVIPVVLTGSFALLLSNFPVPAYQDWLAGFGGGCLRDLLQFVIDSTTGFLSLYLALGISYFYSGTFAGHSLSLRVTAMITACACFIASFGGAGGALELESFGTVGVFTAMVCSILATRLFFALTLGPFRRFRSYADGSDLQFRSSVSGIVPMALCVLLFALGSLLLQKGLRVGSLNDLISGALFRAFGNLRREPGNGVVFLLVQNLLWVLGIHGGNALDPVARTVFSGAAGQGGVVSKSFLDSFAVIGGSGATLCLVLALLLGSRRRGSRRLARSAAPLALFNINELLVFGLPVVLNPVLALPFVLTPVVSMLLAYGAVALELMPPVRQAVEWTTPVFFSGYLATGSWRGAAVQLVILAAGTALYLPFVRLSERLQEEREAFLLGRLTDRFRACEEEGRRELYLSRNDGLGLIAKTLAGQLRADVAQGRVPVRFQPQVDAGGAVVGAEALLRWEFGGKSVYPPLAVALAQEDGCYGGLTWAVLSAACDAGLALRRRLGRTVQVSVNLTPAQLDDPQLTAQIIQLVERRGVGRGLALEVTEETSLAHFPHITANVELLSSHGIELAIDDFSMGHTSLNYLRSSRFRFVKLDGGLVRQVPGNERCREIVGSIVSLGSGLGFQVIAECVESEEIRDSLLQLGCTLFQGYLYGPAMPLEELMDYAGACPAPEE